LKNIDKGDPSIDPPTIFIEQVMRLLPRETTERMKLATAVQDQFLKKRIDDKIKKAQA